MVRENTSLFDEEPNESKSHIVAQADVAHEILKRKHKFRYILKDKIAEGGMGIIYRVQDQDLERKTAIKLMFPDDDRVRDHVTQFIQEARLTSQLQHPNIIPVYDVGVFPGKDVDLPFYTMKCVDGETLDTILERLKQKDPRYIREFPLSRLLDIFRKICDAMAYAHSENILHRDIKPDNIMIGGYGEVLLLDWGLARHCTQEFSGGPNYKKSEDLEERVLPTTATHGRVKGSPSYLSPEQAFGASSEIDKQTDVFLLGATLYQILTYIPPYQGEDFKHCIRKAMKCDYKHPHQTEFGQHAPHTLVEIMLKAMEAKKEFRLASVNDLIALLDNYLLGQTVSSYRFFPRGAVIFSEGEVGQDTYAILSGSVAVSREIMGKSQQVATLGQGDVFGEMGAICKGVRGATITADADCEVLVISKDLLEDELLRLPPWLAKIIVSLAQRLDFQETLNHPFITTDCILATLKQIFFAYNFVKPGSSTNVSLDYRALVHECALNIGVKHGNVEPVLEIFAQSDMVDFSENGSEYIIRDLNELRELILYVDREQMIERGHTLGKKPPINIEKIKCYQKIFDSLKQTRK